MSPKAYFAERLVPIVVLGLKPRALSALGKHHTTKLHPQSVSPHRDSV